MKPYAILLITIILAASTGITPVHAACGTTYTVGRGETLYSIAEKCAIRYVVLININYEISDPNLIRPGQVIRLTAEEPLPYFTQPVSGPDQPYGLQEGRIYIVRKGDSLARIAYLYGTTQWDLYQANPELGGKPSVYTGQRIRLPQDARAKKGWVGISSLGPAVLSSIQARAVDFPPYAPVKFRLHELNDTEVLEGIKNAGPELIRQDDNLSVYIEATTDARGAARVTMKLPSWARNDETWVVDVFTNNLGQSDTLSRSPVMVIGRGF